MVTRRMRSNDGDDEGCCSNDNAIDGAARVDGFNNGAGLTKNDEVLCACVCDCMPREVKVAVMLKDKRTMIMRMMVNMNPVDVCVSGSDTEQPAICRQINPGCA